MYLVNSDSKQIMQLFGSRDWMEEWNVFYLLLLFTVLLHTDKEEDYGKGMPENC